MPHAGGGAALTPRVGENADVRHLPAALGLLLVLAACGGSQDPPRTVESEPTPTVEVPDGVTLTDPGSTLEVGDEGTVVLDLGGGARSVATVRVTDVEEGDIDDFRFFSLDEQAESSTPYYVDVRVTNQGPSGLGGVTLPLLARTDAPAAHPVSELVGDFESCPDPTVPENFLAGSSADLCLIYLVPEGEDLVTIDLQPGEPADALRWSLPTDDD